MTWILQAQIYTFLRIPTINKSMEKSIWRSTTVGVAIGPKAQLAEATKQLPNANQLQPDSACARCEIGATLLKTGDFETAIVRLEIASGRLPTFSPAHLSLAEAYGHTGRTEDAKREHSKVDKIRRTKINAA
jgi:predicted Zn-dependent protease